jgi:L-asparaginase
VKKVVIVTTGGTIAMTKTHEGVVPYSTGNSLITQIPGLEKIARIEHVEFSNVPSPYMTPSMMWELSRLVQQIVNDPDVSGVVITHGTDTLEETSYFLDLTVKTDKPVVFTAAMRNINELGTDGPRNVLSSVRVASSEKSKGMGVMVCLNDEIHAAREVTKTYTSNVATFDSPGYGPLGIVDEDAVIFFRKPLLRMYIDTKSIEERVALVKTFTGDDGEMLRKAVEIGYKGVVLEGFGRGNVPPKVADAVSDVIKKVPVVLTSRCFKGRVLDVYGYKGGGADLVKRGVILGQEVSSQKARIKLMIVLGKTRDRDEIRKYFEVSRAGGEMAI